MAENNWLRRVVVVLVRPEGSFNIGSVCRAMKSMGVKRLSIAVTERKDLDEVPIRKMSLHAFDLYEKALFYPTLEEALAQVSLSVGFTRRRGSRRKYFSLLPEEAAERAYRVGDGDTAFVFGNERTGLDDEELSCCHLASHIPVSDSFPSLNLSHAVQIACAALFRHKRNEVGGYTPLTIGEIDALTEEVVGDLHEIGLVKTPDPHRTDIFLRDIFARASLSPGEANRMKKIFTIMKELSRDGKKGL